MLLESRHYRDHYPRIGGTIGIMVLKTPTLKRRGFDTTCCVLKGGKDTYVMTLANPERL